MARQAAYRTLVALILLISIVAERALACSCAEINVCELVEVSPVIFLGEVIEGGLDPGEDAWSGRPTYAKLRVLESFKGLPVGTREVRIELSYLPGMCSPGVYRRGEVTLAVPSRRPDGSLSDGACSPSRFAADVQKDLTYIRDYFAGRTQTTILGRIAANRLTDLVSFVLDRKEGTPVPDANVLASGTGGTFQTATNKDGEFSLRGMAAGTYRIRAEKTGYDNTDVDYEESPEFEVQVNEKGCAIQDLALWTQNSLTGTIRAASGEGIPGVEIELRNVDQPEINDSERSDSAGEFRFARINPGRYWLAVSPDGATARTRYAPSYWGGADHPDLAQTILIEPRSQMEGYDVILGNPVELRMISVRVELTDGRGVSNGYVNCEQVRSTGIGRKPLEPGASLDKSGETRCEVMTDRPYSVSVMRVGSMFEFSDTPPVVVPPGTADARVVLRLGTKDAAASAPWIQAQ